MNFIWNFRTPAIFFLSLIIFVVAMVVGLKKGKKTGYQIFSVFWLLLGIHLTLLVLTLADSIPNAGMGKPEAEGQLLCAILTVSSFGFLMTIVFNFIFAIVKFDKSHLIQEIVSIIISGLIILGIYNISNSFAQVAEETKSPAMRGFAGQAAGQPL